MPCMLWRMKTCTLALCLWVVGCGGAGQAPPPETPPEVSAPPPSEVPAEQPAAEPEPEPPPEAPVEPAAEPAKEIPCGGSVCKSPEKCITVVGMRPNSARKECWVPCGEGDSCPEGMECSMIHDGPGKVCSKTK